MVHGKGVKKIISHGKILTRPSRQPFGTQNSVGYELGRCFQLDRDHCLLIASMDEQGGGDLCVGNDGFIFERLSDIETTKAIPLNMPDPDYSMRYHNGKAYLAKYPITGGFVPLGARLENGEPHPAAGKGILISEGMTFNTERSSSDVSSEIVFELMQVCWDGKNFTVTERSLVDSAMDLKLMGPTIGYFCLDGADFLMPSTTSHGTVVFRFAFDGVRWKIVDRGEPFFQHQGSNGVIPCGEFEPSLQKVSDGFVLYTRGTDPVGRAYRSEDGLHFKPWFEKRNQMVPQVLNQGLDGSLYLATNPNWDMLRNPLLIYPMIGETFGEPLVIHDQDGVRDDKGSSIPFVDHAVGVNLFLEGRWRHLLWYRACDLKERTFLSFMKGASEEFHEDGKPADRSSFGGLYLAELEYESDKQSFRI